MALPETVIPVLTGKVAEEFTLKAEQISTNPTAKLSEAEAARVRYVLDKSKSFVF